MTQKQDKGKGLLISHLSKVIYAYLCHSSLQFYYNLAGSLKRYLHKLCATCYSSWMRKTLECWQKKKCEFEFVGGIVLSLCLMVFTVVTKILFFLFFFLGCMHGIQKFPSQGLNWCHSSNPKHNSDDTITLAFWAPKELNFLLK